MIYTIQYIVKSQYNLLCDHIPGNQPVQTCTFQVEDVFCQHPLWLPQPLSVSFCLCLSRLTLDVSLTSALCVRLVFFGVYCTDCSHLVKIVSPVMIKDIDSKDADAEKDRYESVESL